MEWCISTEDIKTQEIIFYILFNKQQNEIEFMAVERQIRTVQKL